MNDLESTLGTILDVRDAALRRRSVRAFEPDPVPASDLAAILDVVRRAPSAFNIQPWRFVVVQSPEAKAQLAAAANNQRQVSSAPAVLVLYTDMVDALAHADEVVHPGVDPARREATVASLRRRFAAQTDAEREGWGAEQGNIALGFLLLAAEAHGYQTSAMAGFDPAKVKALLGLPAHVRIPALVAIGRGTEEGHSHHRHALERIVRTV